MKISTIKPLLAMFGSLFMCLILMVSQTASAEPKDNQITITKGETIENTKFMVNGHHFLWQDLTVQQQQTIEKYFDEVDNLEKEIQKSTDIIDSQAEDIEEKVAQLELLLDSVLDETFNSSIHKLEAEISQISFKMPSVDQVLINRLEDKADKIEQLLVTASANISK